MAQLSISQLTEALRIRKLIDDFEKKAEGLRNNLTELLGDTKVAVTKQKRTVKRKAKASKRNVKAAVETGKAATKKSVTKATAKVKRVKGKAQGSFKSAVHQVLAEANKPMSTDEILSALKAKGVKSKSKNPRKTLGVTLYTDKSLQRPGRGLFAAPKQ